MHYISIACLSFLLLACVNNRPDNHVLPPWLIRHLAITDLAGESCLAPTGVFSVSGSSSNADKPYSLDDVLFEDKLAGYPVESIQLIEDPLTGALIVTGILAGVLLQDSTIIKKSNDSSCSDRWSLKVKTDEVDALLRTEALLWTGGLILPINETNQLRLSRAEDGALLVHVIEITWVLGALAIPFKIEKEFWLRYMASGMDEAAGNVKSNDELTHER